MPLSISISFPFWCPSPSHHKSIFRKMSIHTCWRSQNAEKRREATWALIPNKSIPLLQILLSVVLFTKGKQIKVWPLNYHIFKSFFLRSWGNKTIRIHSYSLIRQDSYLDLSHTHSKLPFLVLPQHRVHFLLCAVHICRIKLELLGYSTIMKDLSQGPGRRERKYNTWGNLQSITHTTRIVPINLAVRQTKDQCILILLCRESKEPFREEVCWQLLSELSWA